MSPFRKTQATAAFACLLLIALTAALFFQVRTFDFVNYDDPLYVTHNARVQAGLTQENLAWAFGQLTGEGTYWHPLTWVSHMLDVEWFGLKAGAHHLVSVFWHIANVVLLFLVLRSMTGAFWRSAMVAALFAWHPLQADTVVWIAERKNLLSTFFGLLTLAVYTRYARLKIQNSKLDLGWYALTFFCFALSLLCKPAWVTLPCLLLLLDVWPLRRVMSAETEVLSSEKIKPSFDGKKLLWLAAEKLPLLALSAASSAIAVLAHRKLDLVMPVEHLTLGGRIANSFVSYWRYVKKALWPNDLAVYYPMPEAWPGWFVLWSVVFVGGMSVLAFRWVRKRPYVFTGWYWFVGTLVPFIGLIQVNDQAMADRFAYAPLIGVFVLAVWGGSELLSRLPQRVWLERLIPAGVLGGYFVAAFVQLPHWKNSEALFCHALEVTEGNNIAHINLGVAVEEQGRLDEAIFHYKEALRIKPNNSMARSNLGVTLGKQGKLEEALEHFRAAMNINPDNPDPFSNYGLALTFLKRFDEAESALKEAVRLKPRHAQANHNLGNVYLQQGKFAEAVPHYEIALQSQPSHVEARNNLGLAFRNLGRNEEATEKFKQVIEMNSSFAPAYYNLGCIALDAQKAQEAEFYFLQTLARNSHHPEAHFRLGLLLVDVGRRNEAREHLREAVRLRPELREQIETLHPGALMR